MKLLLATVAMLASLFLPTGAYAQDPQAAESPQAVAGQAAKQWLLLVDSGGFAASWDQAAAAFQAAVSKPSWEGAIRAARTPLGAVKSRTLKSAVFTQSLPGAPDGEYVVIQYDTQFENKAHAVETVTPMREKNGSWRVSGYFVR